MSGFGSESEDRLREVPIGSYSSPYSVPTAVDEHRPPERRVLVPLLLFLATCYSTYEVQGLWYAVPLMLTLTAHEFGHFLQAVRYRVPASFPYFIPMPFSPLGTMGAVIVFRGNMGDRRALFDIGISGPLAGLVPALIFCFIGLRMSHVVSIADFPPNGMLFGDPLIIRWMELWIFGPLQPGEDVMLHPIAFAGWVGVFITALNLMPIGQLDGGHILYALLRRKAQVVAQLLLVLGFVYITWTHNMSYLFMLILLAMIGVRHPPTANDQVPLGAPRIVLGWLTLLFIVVGFTLQPFSSSTQKPVNRPRRHFVISAPHQQSPSALCGREPAGEQLAGFDPLCPFPLV